MKSSFIAIIICIVTGGKIVCYMMHSLEMWVKVVVVREQSRAMEQHQDNTH